MPWGVELTTVAVFVCLSLGLCTWGVVALRRSPYGPLQSVLYLLNVLLTRVLWRAEIVGRFDLPPDRGAVIICNHRSSVDPLFIQLLPGRLVHWMLAAEYYRLPLLKNLFQYMQAIPASRGGVDTSATRQAIRYASEGQLVGMLPEGRINDTGEFLTLVRPGAVLVALRARVPLIPCYLGGAPYDGTVWGCFFKPARVRLVVGRAIDLSPYFDREPTAELLGELMLQAMSQIAQLGGRADFQPRLAGRTWKPVLHADPANQNSGQTGRKG